MEVFNLKCNFAMRCKDSKGDISFTREEDYSVNWLNTNGKIPTVILSNTQTTEKYPQFKACEVFR